MAFDAMRARRPAIVASSLLAALLLLFAVVTAIDARISAIWRVALDSVDDPAAQEHDEATPANAPLAHRGDEAAAGIAVALARAIGHLTPLSESAASLGVDLVPVPRAPPTV
jgi:hypothetical protein